MTPAASTNNNSLPYTISLIPQTEEGLQFYLNNYVPFRLRMLQLSPEAFSSTYSRESSFPPSTWRARLFNPHARTFVAANRQAAEQPSQVVISSLTLVLAADDSSRHGPDEQELEVSNWQVNAMFTLPEARGRGAARGVLEFAEDWAVRSNREWQVENQEAPGARRRERQHVKFSLAVMEGNESAGRFYERVGFKKLGKEEITGGVMVRWYEKRVGGGSDDGI
ncbi:hypothetical protein QBC42DRAFT_294781 [Cladorrhinum samala]|uniref:N-acetyltransferase domain-containing protein n=1 Tax=Cladorrhinum samala TaxID=585594 RepID=A0AAV9HYW2_9PEZI|nr:hypothetical protein QBC42DRAFT_294781 [Cladorrhinum samala]